MSDEDFNCKLRIISPIFIISPKNNCMITDRFISLKGPIIWIIIIIKPSKYIEQV